MVNYLNFLEQSNLENSTIQDLWNSIFNLLQDIDLLIPSKDHPTFIAGKLDNLSRLGYTTDPSNIKNQFTFDSESQRYLKINFNTHQITGKTFLPGTLFLGFYLPKTLWVPSDGPTYFLFESVQTVLNTYFPNAVSLKKPICKMTFNEKKFGSSVIHEAPEYYISVRTIMVNYENYKDLVPFEELSGSGLPLIGIGDEFKQIGQEFPYSEICEAIAQDLNLKI